MKNDSKNKAGEVVVETVTVVEEVPSSVVVEEVVPQETIIVTNGDSASDTLPTQNTVISSTPQGDASYDVDTGETGVSRPTSSQDATYDTTTGETGASRPTSSRDATLDADSFNNTSDDGTSSKSPDNTGGQSVGSSGNQKDDPAESKLKDNASQKPASNAQGSSNTANRLRNNNPNNGTGNNNPTNKLGNNNNLNNKVKDNKADDSAKQKLANNKFNKAKNLPFFNRKKNKSKDNNTKDSTMDVSDNDNGKEDLIKKAKKIKMIASIIMACLPVVFIILILVVVMSTVGSLVNMFGIVSTGGGGDFPTSMTDNPNEQKYYNKLDSVVVSYRTKCGISLNKNYIHAILFYPIQNYDDFFDQDFEIMDDDSSGEVDYNSLAGKVDTVAKLMVNNCSVDYEVGGTSYERVKNSSFFKKYYKDLLEDSDADSVLTSVFDLAEAGTEMFSNSWYINDNLKVVQKTCNTYEYLNGTKENSTVGFSEYIMGVLYGELAPNSEIVPENKEFLKAQVIAATSYALARANYQSGDTEIEVSNGNCWQLSCNINEGCTYAYDLGSYGTCYIGIQDKDKVDWKRDPISSSKLSLIQGIMEEVFGTVMLDSSGDIKEPQYRNSSCGNDCMGQQPGMLDAQNGMTYEEILEKYYDNFTLSNVSEDLYADVTYEDGGYTSNVVYYNQKNYNDKFCGRTDGTIATSGCGVTSMAIVLSTFLDDSYTPPVVMNEAYNFGSCGRGISGTATSFFKKSAKLHNLGYQRVGKKGDLQAVLNALNNGNSLVIAHMGPGTFTRSGHYIVLARVNKDGKVYVYDPNNPDKNGWHDFNSVIVKQLRGSFYIITKG